MQVRLVVEQHTDYFLVHLPSFMISGRGSTLEQAILNFKKYYDLYSTEFSEERAEADDLLDIYITTTILETINDESKALAV